MRSRRKRTSEWGSECDSCNHSLLFFTGVSHKSGCVRVKGGWGSSMQLLAKCVFLGLLSRCCSRVFIDNGGWFAVGGVGWGVAWIELTVSHCQQKLRTNTTVDSFRLLGKFCLFSYLGLVLRGLAATVHEYILDSNSTAERGEAVAFQQIRNQCFSIPAVWLEKGTFFAFWWFKPLQQVFVGNLHRHWPQGWKLHQLTSIFQTLSPYRVGISTYSFLKRCSVSC